MIPLLIMLSITDNYNRGYIVDEFDMIEVNHYHNEWGRPMFAQLICWDRNVLGDYHVQAYVMMKDAYVETEEGRKKHEEWLSKELEGKPAEYQIEARQGLKYRGDFVGGKIYPYRDHHSGYYISRYYDSSDYRIIKAKLFRESWTQYDPERVDRKYLKEADRRGLTKEEHEQFQQTLDRALGG